jgi:hypothetical protein
MNCVNDANAIRAKDAGVGAFPKRLVHEQLIVRRTTRDSPSKRDRFARLAPDDRCEGNVDTRYI